MIDYTVEFYMWSLLTFLVAYVHHHDDIGAADLTSLVQGGNTVANLQRADSFQGTVGHDCIRLRINTRALDIRYC